MGRPKIDYKVVLKALDSAQELPWRYRTIVEGNRDKISLKEFRKILMVESEITGAERKVLELWRMMIDLDFFIKVNASDTVLIDLGPVCKALGYRVYTKDEYRLLNGEKEEVEECQAAL
ncbi:hypothetical protein SDC9_194138 [bioreactor metagenome]|uniref:Uncharacterized protein n=1 Tax=bioreactor metagenome TaxID=1076179 RepID=A0A645I831_9ZZZZ